jgi:dUTP pyrophosphatase
MKQMSKPTLKVQYLEHGVGLQQLQYATPGSSGMDVLAAVPENEPLIIKPMERKLVPLGFKCSFSEEFEIQIRPRSGNALKKGMTVPNSPGTVDSDYRGEMMVIVINLSAENIEIKRGDRIAQAVLCPVSKANVVKVESLNDTVRGAGGFGSTGS